jgi:CxxC-x17-CxxC domain-containing protein
MIASDKTLICRDCGREFLFTVGEQEFYTERGFVAPSRCPNCRANRRMERQAIAGDGYTARASGPGYREPRPMFAATCADCGRDTMVPFEPRPGRAVYCRECFQRHRDEFR